MPGMLSRAPLRTLTRSGFRGSPNFLPVSFSISFTKDATSASSPLGNDRLFA